MKLGLGTAQFGLPYGIANPKRKVSAREVEKILALARSRDIDLLDTAVGYGTSEQVLGKILKSTEVFKIVTKIAPLRVEAVGHRHLGRITRDFEESLKRLQRKNIYGLLVHHSDDLLVPGGDRIYDRLADWRAEGRVSKIGISVYSGQHIDRILARFPVDLIQLPISVLDQRLIRSGHLSLLKSKGVKIHARSAFLQGLLLMPPENVDPFFKPIHEKLVAFHRAARDCGVSTVELALQFLRQRAEIDRVIVGVISAAQLEEVAVAATRPSIDLDYSRFTVTQQEFLDPSSWKLARS